MCISYRKLILLVTLMGVLSACASMREKVMHDYEFVSIEDIYKSPDLYSNSTIRTFGTLFWTPEIVAIVPTGWTYEDFPEFLLYLDISPSDVLRLGLSDIDRVEVAGAMSVLGRCPPRITCVPVRDSNLLTVEIISPYNN